MGYTTFTDVLQRRRVFEIIGERNGCFHVEIFNEDSLAGKLSWTSKMESEFTVEAHVPNDGSKPRVNFLVSAAHRKFSLGRFYVNAYYVIHFCLMVYICIFQNTDAHYEKSNTKTCKCLFINAPVLLLRWTAWKGTSGMTMLQESVIYDYSIPW